MENGESFWFEIDLLRHRIVLETTSGERARLDMAAGRMATEMGEKVLAAVGGLGLSGTYDRQRFEDDGERVYEPAAAKSLCMALVEADAVLNLHRESLSGDVSPVQFWPHHFDLSCEWFGTRTESVEEAGQTQELPAQINFGFYPGEPAYFYANPWPFDSERLLDQPLPAGACWHVEGWQGSILPYSELVGSAEASHRLRSYFEAVYRVASPLLLA